MSHNLITILGPTATGKTKLASMLAHEFGGEIISADSRQVYKGMDIGTGKDLSDYFINNRKVPYHLIDIVSPNFEFSVYDFKQEFIKTFIQITVDKKIPFLAGGTGLYLSSILQKYEFGKANFSFEQQSELTAMSLKELSEILAALKPALHNTTDLIDKERLIKAILVARAEGYSEVGKDIEINSLNIGIMPDREIIKERITERLKYRLSNGMIEEVEKLLADGVSFEKLNFFGLEYKFIGMYLNGRLNYNDMFQKLNSAIHQFAKRQATWFRKMEREGVKIIWLNSPNFNKAKEIITQEYFYGH